MTEADIERVARAIYDTVYHSDELFYFAEWESPARAAIAAMPGWRPIETAPRDGTMIVVYAPPRHGLDALVSFCAYHENAGFCIDELRAPTLWHPLPAPQESEKAR